MPAMRAACGSESIAPLNAKLTSFKSAINTGKNGAEQVHNKRLDRYSEFCQTKKVINDECTSKSASRRFKLHERKGILAKAKVWTTADFEVQSVLGEGSFGVVYLAKKKGHEDFFALKQMKKAGFAKKNCRQRIYAERDILAEAQSRWIVDLYLTFQDSEHVYMAMEFLQGGDLIGHILARKRLSLSETQFYMGELLEALDTVHRCGFVHRDVKPDNVVLTPEGHLKLLDFGLCSQDIVSMVEESASQFVNPNDNLRAQFKSTVGTPQYMAVEVYQGAYGPEADLWSLGIITYECLVGIVPFHGDRYQGREAIKLIRSRVLQHETVLEERLAKARARGYMPQLAEDFLWKMICVRSKRLNAEQCRRDPFFEGLDFSRLHELLPPIVPTVASASDVSHFDKFPFRELPQAETGARKDSAMEWAGYDYDKELNNVDCDVNGFFQSSLRRPREMVTEHNQPHHFYDQIASPSPNSTSLALAPFLLAHGHQDPTDTFA